MRSSTTEIAVRHLSTRASERRRHSDASLPSACERGWIHYLLSFFQIDGRRYISVSFQLFKNAGRNEKQTFLSLDDLMNSTNIVDRSLAEELNEYSEYHRGDIFLLQSQKVTGVILKEMIATKRCFVFVKDRKVRIKNIQELRNFSELRALIESSVKVIKTNPKAILKLEKLKVTGQMEELVLHGYRIGQTVFVLRLFFKYGRYRVDPAPYSSSGHINTSGKNLIRQTTFERGAIRSLVELGLNKFIVDVGENRGLIFIPEPLNANRKQFDNLLKLLHPFLERRGFKVIDTLD